MESDTHAPASHKGAEPSTHSFQPNDAPIVPDQQQRQQHHHHHHQQQQQQQQQQNNRPFSAKASIKKFFRRHVSNRHTGSDLSAPPNGAAESHLHASSSSSHRGKRLDVSQPILIAGSTNLPDRSFSDKQVASLSTHTAQPRSQENPPHSEHSTTSLASTPKRRMSSRFKLTSDTKTGKSGGGNSQDPSLLYKALPRSIKHANLASPAVPAETIIQYSAQHGGQHSSSALSRDDVDAGRTAPGSSPHLDVPNQGAIRKLIHNEKNRKPSLKYAETTQKLFLIMVNGYLLQYSQEGTFDRPPEKAIQLGHKTVAFSSDAVPGRPFVLQVSEMADIADYTTLSTEKKKFLHRFTFSDHKPQSTSMLLIFDAAEEMEIWLNILQKEIEHFRVEERSNADGWRGTDSIKRFSKSESLSWNLHLPISDVKDVQEQQGENEEGEGEGEPDGGREVKHQEVSPPSPLKSSPFPQISPRSSVLSPADRTAPSSPDTKRLSYASVGLMTISAAEHSPNIFPTSDHSSAPTIEERQSTVSPRSSIRRRSSPEPSTSERVSREAPADAALVQRTPALASRNQGPSLSHNPVSNSRRSSAQQPSIAARDATQGHPPSRRPSVGADHRFSQDLTDIPEATNDFANSNDINDNDNRRHSARSAISPVPKDDQSLNTVRSPRKRRSRRCSASAIDRTRHVSDPLGQSSHSARHMQQQQHRRPQDTILRPSSSTSPNPPDSDNDVPEVPKVPENLQRQFDPPLPSASPTSRKSSAKSRRPMSMQPAARTASGAASTNVPISSLSEDPSARHNHALFLKQQRASVPYSSASRHRMIGPIPPEFYDFGNPPLSPPPSCPLPSVPATNRHSADVSSRRQSREVPPSPSGPSSRRQSREIPGSPRQQSREWKAANGESAGGRHHVVSQPPAHPQYAARWSSHNHDDAAVAAKEAAIAASSDRNIKRKSIPIVVPPDDDVTRHTDDLRAKEMSMINAF